jgi:hypothetical protein
MNTNGPKRPGKMKTMTTEQIRRINKEIAETVRLLAKECGYSADLRNQEYLDSLNRHLATLRGMLK